MDKLTTIISNTTTVDNGNCSIGRLAIEQYGEQRLFSIRLLFHCFFPEQKKEQSVKAMRSTRSHPNDQRLFPFKLIQKPLFISYQRI